MAHQELVLGSVPVEAALVEAAQVEGLGSSLGNQLGNQLAGSLVSLDLVAEALVLVEVPVQVQARQQQVQLRP